MDNSDDIERGMLAVGGAVLAVVVIVLVGIGVGVGIGALLF